MVPKTETRRKRKSRQPNAKCTKNECTARWVIGGSVIGALKAQLNLSTNTARHNQCYIASKTTATLL